MRTKITFVFLIMVLLTACASSNTTPTQVVPLSGNVDVTISNYAFSPADLTVKVGTVVTWTNQDSVVHNVTATDNSFASSDLNQGDKFTYTFNTAGTFPYRCGFHANMKATVTVVP